VVGAGVNAPQLRHNGSVRNTGAGSFNSAAATVAQRVALASTGGDDVFVTKLNYADLNTARAGRGKRGKGNDVVCSLLANGSNVYVGAATRARPLPWGSTTLTKRAAWPTCS
jgi:hypothetical protein